MNTISIFENFNLFFPPQTLNYSSDSFVEPIDKIKEQIVDDKFSILKNDIGEELFNQLSYDDKIFMIETAGTIDFGHPIDFDKLGQYIKNYDN